MSILTLRARPIVAFDENNPKHREEYYKFTVKRSWGHSPVRFMADDGASTNLVSHVSGKMLSYYVKKEFKNKKVK
jgi:hypothetical protein